MIFGMKLKKINYSPTFLKGLKKLPKDQLKSLARQEKIFLENPFYPRLKTHKLKGELKDSYSFSVSYHWRIVFHLEKNHTMVLDAIGTHAIYK